MLCNQHGLRLVSKLEELDAELEKLNLCDDKANRQTCGQAKSNRQWTSESAALATSAFSEYIPPPSSFNTEDDTCTEDNSDLASTNQSIINETYTIQTANSQTNSSSTMPSLPANQKMDNNWMTKQTMPNKQDSSDYSKTANNSTQETDQKIDNYWETNHRRPSNQGTANYSQKTKPAKSNHHVTTNFIKETNQGQANYWETKPAEPSSQVTANYLLTEEEKTSYQAMADLEYENRLKANNCFTTAAIHRADNNLMTNQSLPNNHGTNHSAPISHGTNHSAPSSQGTNHSAPSLPLSTNGSRQFLVQQEHHTASNRYLDSKFILSKLY